MIRITTRERYALRAMIDLALHGHAEPVARQAIADRQNISADYVAQLFRQLQDAGLVEGVKGPGGGYRLACDAEQIRTREIIEAVEGPIALVDCVDPQSDSSCTRAERCATHLLWKRLSETMQEFLDSVTLRDLCEEAQDLRSSCLPSGVRSAGGTPSCGP